MFQNPGDKPTRLRANRLSLFTRLSKMLGAFKLLFMQGVSGEKVNILGGVSIDHCERKLSYDHASNSEWSHPVLSGNQKDLTAVLFLHGY